MATTIENKTRSLHQTSWLEKVNRRMVERVVADGDYEEINGRDNLREAILAAFTEQLDGKIQNIHCGEALAVKFRFDIIGRNGKVRGGTGPGRNMPEYGKWRTAVYARDNYACQECGSKEKINAHHIKSWRCHKEPRFDVNNGQTLCKDCHWKKHPHFEKLPT